jgi:hypothetical protein
MIKIFMAMLTTLFVALKLLGVSVVATWSWWLVLAPLWVPIAFFLFLVFCIGAMYLIGYCTKKHAKS